MGLFKTIPPPFESQALGTEFLVANDRVFDMSDPGTGKTRKALDAILKRRKQGAGKALVFAPRSILVPAWANDCKKFTPSLKTSVATAKNRAKAFKEDADIYITNHDAVKWVAQNTEILTDFDILVIDESTAFKHRTSQRSKAMNTIAKHFPIRWIMTGTPNPNSVTDLWHQVFLLDEGKRLGTSFWKFRAAVCEPQQVGPDPSHIKWVDKDGAVDVVADLLEDITIRDVFEECVDIPEHSIHTITFTMSPKHREMYETMRDQAIIELTDEDYDISAPHAGQLANKLLQVASGAVYNDERISKSLASDRNELVMDLAEQRGQCVIAFNWKHQRDELTKLADKRGWKYAVVDGDTKEKQLPIIVNQFQSGEIHYVFAQPQSAAHGLTLTRGTATIWVSPTYNAEHFTQLNRRIYRAGQTRKTETLLVCAEDTLEANVYNKLQGKLSKMNGLLDFLT